MDIIGKDGGSQPSPNDKVSFALPPPAIAPAPACEAHIEGSEPTQSRTGFEYLLPPPPTRIRKIVQMTPNIGPRGNIGDSGTDKTPSTRRQTPTRKTNSRKQPSSTSQAGKRIARKTAHSVIERRRRSKMNEEFGVLKDMIPACKNQEMHKLAILQASIEYLRYLEQCVTELKTANGMDCTAIVQKTPPPFQRSSKLQRDAFEHDGTDDDDDDDSDVGMAESSDRPSVQTDYQAQTSSAYGSPDSTAPSPALDVYQYHKWSANTVPYSTLPSPTTGLYSSASRRSLHVSTCSASTSPNLVPTSSKDADEEATETLMMLREDRRSANASSSSSHGRGMSVKDLLSS